MSHKQQIRNVNVHRTPLNEHVDTCGEKLFILFPFNKLNDTSKFEKKIKGKWLNKMFKPVLRENNDNAITTSNDAD